MIRPNFEAMQGCLSPTQAIEFAIFLAGSYCYLSDSDDQAELIGRSDEVKHAAFVDCHSASAYRVRHIKSGSSHARGLR